MMSGLAFLAAASLLASPCTQPPELDCVSVPKAEAVVALRCVAADLPRCRVEHETCLGLGRSALDACEDREAILRRRGDDLQALLDAAPLPPPVPWYERPAVVGPVAAALGAGVVVLVYELTARD